MKKEVVLTSTPGCCVCTAFGGMTHHDAAWWVVGWEEECGPEGHTRRRILDGPFPTEEEARARE